MDIQQTKGAVRITNISKEEICLLLKCKCKMKVIARNYEGKAISFIYLLDRTDTGKIIVSTSKSRAVSRTKKELTFNEVVELVNGLYELAKDDLLQNTANLKLSNKELLESSRFNNIIEVVLSKELYAVKKPLIDLIPDISKNLINSLVSLEFDNTVYIIRFKDTPNYIGSIYYWPETKELYAFDSDDAKFDYAEEGKEQQFKNIRDVLKIFE